MKSSFINTAGQRTFLTVIYSWYESAMNRRRLGSALSLSGFKGHFMSSSYNEMMAYGNSKDGYVLGEMSNGVFKISHFAPRTIRGGYKVLKDLGLEKSVALLCVTEDLDDMLSKLGGWEYTGIVFPSFFRDPCMKYVWINCSRLALIVGRVYRNMVESGASFDTLISLVMNSSMEEIEELSYQEMEVITPWYEDLGYKLQDSFNLYHR